MLYFVYELVDSRTGATGYVGITNDPNQRYYEHMGKGADKGKKYEWIKHLQEEGTRPDMKILEIVDGVKQARIREKYWVQHYISKGIELANVLLTKTDPKGRSTPVKHNRHTETKEPQITEVNLTAAMQRRRYRPRLPRHPILGTHYLTESQSAKMQKMPIDIFRECVEYRCSIGRLKCVPVGKSVRADGIRYTAKLEPLYSYKDLKAWRDEGDY